MSEPVCIYVGSDRSQLIPFQVLEYSIRRHTRADVRIVAMDNLKLAEPADPRHGSRTGFSFTRFAIPYLTGYRGAAIYLDADMQVFGEIEELASIPFEGAHVVIQDDLPEAHQPKAGTIGAPQRRIKQCSVMRLDCDKLNWVPQDIIKALGVEYSYEDLLYHLCLLEESQIRYAIPFEWNSLETFVPGRTRLIHYTDMYTQPWVSAENPNGWLWIEELRRMLSEGRLNIAAIEREVKLGYFRPSILQQLSMAPRSGPLDQDVVAGLERMDAKHRFVKHAEIYERKRRRRALIAEYERAAIQVA